MDHSKNDPPLLQGWKEYPPPGYLHDLSRSIVGWIRCRARSL